MAHSAAAFPNPTNNQNHNPNIHYPGLWQPTPNKKSKGKDRKARVPQNPSFLEALNRLSPKPAYLKKIDNLSLLREGPIIQWGMGKRGPKQRYFFVFNGILVITKPFPGGKQNPRWIILLNSRKRVEDVPDSTYHVPNVEFRLYSPIRSFIFFASSQQERDQWIDIMRQQIAASERRENPVMPYDEKNELKC